MVILLEAHIPRLASSITVEGKGYEKELICVSRTTCSGGPCQKHDFHEKLLPRLRTV